MLRTYTELCRYSTFLERFEYLKLDGEVGADTFGFDRYLNQIFYNSYEWRRFRDRIIVRDKGCDLGVEGYEINGYWKDGRYIAPKVVIHHLNPIAKEDILNRTDILMNPEYVITTIHSTHMAIHYGDADRLEQGPTVRKPNDTCPWRHSTLIQWEAQETQKERQQLQQQLAEEENTQAPADQPDATTEQED